LEKILIRGAEIDVANLLQNCSQENNNENKIQVFQTYILFVGHFS
jgi:hypothetical protein